MGAVDLDALPRSDMAFVEPMRPTLASVLPEGPNWQYEIKWDGYRALAITSGRNATLVSRRNNSFVNRFPSIAAALNRLEDGTILDGEIVALDAHGKPSFNLLQHHADNARALVYVVFDVLAFKRRDVRQLPLLERRGLLDEILKSVRGSLCAAPILNAAPEDLIPVVKAERLEGIVAKRIDSRYDSRGRNGAWVKFRVNQSHALIVGGYRFGDGSFENLAVGCYDDRGRLMFVAKINNGFTADVKAQIFQRLRMLETQTCPFDNLPQRQTGRWGEGLPAEAMRAYRWVRPALVATVEFAEWTADGHLRHARFVAVRDDKDPKDVRNER